jgi:hypothetical protein
MGAGMSGDKVDFFAVGYNFVYATMRYKADKARLSAEAQRLMSTSVSDNIVVAAGMVEAIDELTNWEPETYGEEAAAT